MSCCTGVQYRQPFKNLTQTGRVFKIQKLRGRDIYKVQGILDSWRRSKGLMVEDKPPQTEYKKQQNSVEDDYDDELCPVECVKEIFTPKQFKTLVKEAPKGTLVVCDFYKRSCGACKYIQPGFVKLCKSVEASDTPTVTFIKHNVFDDEEEELTDLAKKLQVKMVPLFHLYKNGELVDSFPTREKKKILEKINQNIERGSLQLVK